MKHNSQLPHPEILYCQKTDRWQVHGLYTKPAALHCGEQFLLLVEGRYLPCRLELDKDWYVIFEDIRFYLHKRTRYQISLF